MTLTTEREQEIRERVAKATAEPWDCRRELVSADMYHVCLANVHRGYNGAQDAEFIAHARQDVPDLLAEIERLRARYYKMRDEYCEAAGNALEALTAAKAENERLRGALKPFAVISKQIRLMEADFGETIDATGIECELLHAARNALGGDNG